MDWDVKRLHEDLLPAIAFIESGRVADGLKIIRTAEIQVEWEIWQQQLKKAS